jgi:chaperonin cofactor prefoldin
MPSPENHTLRLLQEIRGSLRSVDQKVDGLSDKVDRIRDDLKNRVDDLTRVFAGESVLGRYAAADVDKRLEALEKRISVLEKRR